MIVGVLSTADCSARPATGSLKLVVAKDFDGGESGWQLYVWEVTWELPKQKQETDRN
jgi:hypothetical protein